jgi:nicotinamidase-related amidase
MVTKNILVVIDMQNDFIYGKFSTKEEQNIVKPIFEEICNNTIQYDTIIFTKDSHDNKEFSLDWTDPHSSFEGRNFKEHCVELADKDIVYPISKAIKYENTTIGLKAQFDGSWRVADILEETYYDRSTKFNIYICGVCTDICVLATAIGMTKYKNVNKITVLTDLCAGTSPKSHKTAIAAMQSFKINTETTKQIKKRKKEYAKYTTTKGE